MIIVYIILAFSLFCLLIEFFWLDHISVMHVVPLNSVKNKSCFFVVFLMQCDDQSHW